MNALNLQTLLRRGNTKKWLALGLVCLLVLLICLRAGPARQTAPETLPPATEPDAPSAPAATEAPPPEPENPAELAGLRVRPEEYVAALAARPGEAAVLLSHWDAAADGPRYRVVLADPASAAVTASVELKSPAGRIELSDFAVDDAELLLIDRSGERCAAFDRTGRFTGWRDYPTMSRSNLGWRNELLVDDCFRKDPELAQYNDSFSEELPHAIAFYDETDRLHVLHTAYDSVAASLGHRLLLQQNQTDGKGQDLFLADLDAGLCLDRVRFTPRPGAREDWYSISGAAMAEDWVLVALDWDGERSSRHSVCIWRPDGANAVPLDAETWDAEWLSQQVRILSAAIRGRGITLHLDEAPPAELTPTLGLGAEENLCQTGASLFGEYRILKELRAFLGKLPADFVPQLYSQMPGWSPWERDTLHVYIVRNIPGDAAAFANAWSDPMLVCFATEEYSSSHPAHEFMHIMDFRLSQYLSSRGRDLEDEWWALSPDFAYNDPLSPEQEEALEPYFVSYYARTNSAEDRAETFQRLFDSTEPLEEEWWYAEKPGVQAKLRWLVKNLRAAFPSVAATASACWEKLPQPSE